MLSRLNIENQSDMKSETIERRIERLSKNLSDGQKRELSNGAVWEERGILFGLKAKCGFFTPVELNTVHFDVCPIEYSDELCPNDFYDETFNAIFGETDADKERHFAFKAVQIAKGLADAALKIGSKKFIVRYYYLATGMEGNADISEREVWAESEGDAIEKYVLSEYPLETGDLLEGRRFLRGCLSAKEQ